MASKTMATKIKRKRKKTKEGKTRKRLYRNKGTTLSKKALFGD